jgi:hypothetical protein
MRWAIRFLGILILLATLLPSETRAAARESICNPVGELEYSEECSQLVRLYRLGQQEFQSGGYENTLVYFKASLAISEKEIKGARNTTTILNALALTYKIQKNYGAAESLYKRSLAIREKYCGKNHPSYYTPKFNRGKRYIVNQKIFRNLPRNG